MLFNTPQFVIFLVVFLFCWFLLPGRCRKAALIFVSYGFSWFLGGLWTVIILGAITVLTYIWGLIISKTRFRKLFLALYLFFIITFMAYGRYASWINGFINSKFPNFDPAVPWITLIGLSYYSLSAISYIVDIFRGTDVPDKSFPDVCLWLAFFPKFISGPIERHNSFKKQINKLPESKFDIERIKKGLLICSCGYFYKIIIADRLGLFVDSVYADLLNQAGLPLFLAFIFYSLQIYFDFCGYSMIAFGISYVMDIRISENFNKPYFSAGITEFWRRWHLSLSSWLRDYIYIPLGGSRKGRLRQYLNILLTFLISGIWHGSGMNYLIWGGLHGVFQIIEKMIGQKIKLPHFVQIILTFFSVSFAWIFFRSDSIRTARNFIKHMIVRYPKLEANGVLTNFGLDIPDWIVLSISLFIALTAEILQFNGISLYEKLQKQNIVIRWGFYYLMITVLLIFGIYGQKFNANNFIYFRF